MAGASLPSGDALSSVRAMFIQHPPEIMSNKLEDVEPVACGCLEGRNLVVCIDGTSNQFSVKVGVIFSILPMWQSLDPLSQNSNVVELYSRLIKDESQITYYNSGIGTYVKDSKSPLSWDAWKQSLRHNLDMAIARYAHLVS